MGPVRQNPIHRTVSLFICVCIALCTIVAHNIVQNRPDSFPPYPPDNHHCSDDVYLREGGNCVLMRFVVTSFFLVNRYVWSRSFGGFFDEVTANIFLSVKKMMLTSWTKFLSNSFEWLSLAWKFASLSSGSLRFLSINVSQGSVATR